MADIPKYEIALTHTAYDDDIVRSVGEFFLGCASAEAPLAFLLAQLQCHPNAATLNGLAVITGMQNKLMLEKISTTLAILAPEHHDELDAICQKIRKVFEHRNSLAHSSALKGAGRKIVVTPLTIRAPIKLHEKAYDATQLRGFNARLAQLIRHLSQRMNDIGVARSKPLTLPKPLVPRDR